ncbi:MAG: GAF domain-containing protein [Longimicrobiales bacterium]
MRRLVLQNSTFEQNLVVRQIGTEQARQLGALHRQRESLLRFVESISAELALRPLLTQIIRLACDLIDADKGTVGLFDAGRNVFRTEAIWNMPLSEVGTEMPPGVGLAGKLMLARQPVILERYGDVERPIGIGRQLDDAVIGFPIDLDGEMIGFLGIGMASPSPGVAPRRRFTQDDARALAVFARHAAIAIRNARWYEAEQRRTALFELVAGIAHIMTADLRPAELLQNVADAIDVRFGYPNVAIALIEPVDPDVIVIRAVSGPQKKAIEQAGSWSLFRIPIAEGITGAAIREKRTIIVNDVASDPRYIRTPTLDEVTAELAVPIILAGRVLGVLNVESSGPFGEEDADALGIVADQLAIAIENARLYEQAQRLAILEERQRLARELHDSVTQQIFGITLLAESLDPVWQRDAQEGEARAQQLLRLSRAALAEMRALLAELRPADADPYGGRNDHATWIGRLRKTGLVGTLRGYLSGAQLGSTMVQLDAEAYSPQAEQIETVLYRIAREALHNVVKHARASRLELRLASDDSTVRLSISDDGKGFDRTAVLADATHSPGFASMTEQAAAVGGEIRIEASPGRGARVDAILPTRTGR